MNDLACKLHFPHPLKFTCELLGGFQFSIHKYPGKQPFHVCSRRGLPSDRRTDRSHTVLLLHSAGAPLVGVNLAKFGPNRLREVQTQVLGDSLALGGRAGKHPSPILTAERHCKRGADRLQESTPPDTPHKPQPRLSVLVRTDTSEPSTTVTGAITQTQPTTLN